MTKRSHILLSVPVFVNFSFNPMKFSVIDFSAPIRASDFKLCLHLQAGKVYCVNKNKDPNPHLSSFFQKIFFFLCHLYNTYGHFSSVKDFSATT